VLAATKRGIKSNPQQMTIKLKAKTFSIIREILEILIQNQMKGDGYYNESCLGEDAKHRISTIGLRKNIMSIRHYLRKLA
jgi:hypothetical protein